MGKIRVYQVAKELGIDNQDLVSRILDLGIAIRNHMSSLEPEEIARVKQALDRQRHEEMVEEEIKPGVTRRRAVQPRAPARKAIEAREPEPPASAPPMPVPPTRRTPPEKGGRRGAVPAPPESAVLPSARPPSLRSAQPTTETVEAVSPPAIVPELAPPEPPAPPGRHALADEQVELPSPPAPSSDEGAPDTPQGEAADEAPLAPPPRPEPPGPPARPEPPARRAAVPVQPPPPPARPEPPVSARRSSVVHDPSRFVDLPPRVVERAVPTEPFQLGPPSAGRARRGRRQEVQGRDLHSARVAPSANRARPGRKKKAAPGRKTKQTEITVPKEIKRVIRIEETITLQELAKRMGVKAMEVVAKLMEMGVGSIHINSTLDADTAKIIAEEFSYQVEDVSVSEEELLAEARHDADEEATEEELELRPPVVTMLGHVDHGKTSLLDKIRETRVALGEAGGITQHIGAYQVDVATGGTITFIDTPGHEAFTAMRARGAKATDIAVLVVAADDGVMPTTREAMNHAKAAETPIIVALNKMDLDDANPDLALRGLAEEGLQPEEWGGDTVVCRVSAKTGAGIDQLLEMIMITAEMMELRATPTNPAQGVVLEAKLEKGRGPVATVLVQDGTLKVGDFIVVGAEHGKVRAMTDELGEKLIEAGPSTPVEILGLSGTPLAGDRMDVVADARKGEQLADMRAKAASAAATQPTAAIADVMERLKAAQDGSTIETVNLIIKGDVQGSVEAIREKVTSMSTSDVEVKVIHSAVGGITESDVQLASASDPKAHILGFNVRTTGKARTVAEREHVELHFHSIIYELLDEVKALMVGRLHPTYREVELGHAEVRQTFHIPKVGTIAGCHVTDGKVVRSAQVRLIRDAVEIWKGRLGSLKRFKDDAKEVVTGFECGIGLDGYNDVKVGDVIEAFDMEEIAPTL
jgi:translation initiation factor IF-2